MEEHKIENLTHLDISQYIQCNNFVLIVTIFTKILKILSKNADIHGVALYVYRVTNCWILTC